MAAFLVILSIATYAELVYSIPPPQCFAKFRWDDCGKPPTPVLYYWKPGSRCEVGIWRGCLPNMNMFKDEYECVTTCIFTVRAADSDFHQINADDGDATIDDYDELGVTTESANITETDASDAGGDNVTTVEGETGGQDYSDTTTDSADDLISTEGEDSGDPTTTPEDAASDGESAIDPEEPTSEPGSDGPSGEETTTEEEEPA